MLRGHFKGFDDDYVEISEERAAEIIDAWVGSGRIPRWPREPVRTSRLQRVAVGRAATPYSSAEHSSAGIEGARVMSTWEFLRSAVFFAVSPEGALVAREASDGVPLWTCYTEKRSAEVARPRRSGIRLAAVHEMIARLPEGTGVVVNAGKPDMTVFEPEVVDALRRRTAPLPTGGRVLWEAFPLIEQEQQLRRELGRTVEYLRIIDRLWLVGFQLEDATHEGVAVVSAHPKDNRAVQEVASALDMSLDGLPAARARLHAVTLDDLPPDVREFVRAREPLFSRTESPAAQPHVRSTVDHLDTVIRAEEGRGNRVAGAEPALFDGRPAVVMSNPLDIDALTDELTLSEGHAIEHLGGRGAVTCLHGTSIVGGSPRPKLEPTVPVRRRWWQFGRGEP